MDTKLVPLWAVYVNGQIVTGTTRPLDVVPIITAIQKKNPRAKVHAARV